jgi:hypothetical protein
VKRTKTQGRPARVPSPWMLKKISVTRMGGAPARWPRAPRL